MNASTGRVSNIISEFEGSWKVVTLIKQTSPVNKSFIHIDGGLFQEGTTTTTARAVNGVLSIGSYSGDSYTFDGDIAEIIMYDHGLTDSNRESIERYLGTKWDISLELAPVVDNSIDRSGLALWLDANDPIANGSTKWNNGQSIGGDGFHWKDKSGNDFDVSQPVESKRPSYLLNGQNGKPVIAMSDIDMRLRTIDDISIEGILDDSLDEISIILVQKQYSPNVNATSFSYSSEWPGGIRVYAAWSNVIYYDFGNNGSARISREVINFAGKWNIITSIKSPSPINKSTIYLNGEFFDQGNVSFSFDSNYKTPIRIYSTEGELAEVIVYDHALTDSNRDAVESYLGNKWNITLP